MMEKSLLLETTKQISWVLKYQDWSLIFQSKKGSKNPKLKALAVSERSHLDLLANSTVASLARLRRRCWKRVVVRAWKPSKTFIQVLVSMIPTGMSMVLSNWLYVC